MTETAPESLAIPGGELRLWQDVGCPGSLCDTLREATPWRQEDITLFGKTHRQPRLIAWHGDVGTSYRYSGRTWQPLPWTPLLEETRRRVEAVCGFRFNSVLLNYYRDQRDSMGYHADDEPELGDQPVIASLSLGETRRFFLRHRFRKDLATIKLALPHDSLLLMAGDTQRYWKHAVPKETRPCAPRINLTFRWVTPRQE